MNNLTTIEVIVIDSTIKAETDLDGRIWLFDSDGNDTKLPEGARVIELIEEAVPDGDHRGRLRVRRRWVSEWEVDE